jgi:hypothetical protein
MAETTTKFQLPDNLELEVDGKRIVSADRFTAKAGTVQVRLINKDTSTVVWEGIVPVGQDIKVYDSLGDVHLLSAGIETPQTDEISPPKTGFTQERKCNPLSFRNPLVLAIIIALIAALIYYVYQRM